MLPQSTLTALLYKTEEEFDLYLCRFLDDVVLRGDLIRAKCIYATPDRLPRHLTPPLLPPAS